MTNPTFPGMLRGLTPIGRFVRAYPPAAPPPGAGHWFLFRKTDLLLAAENAPLDTAPSVYSGNALFLGTLDGVPCFAATMDENAEIPPGRKAVNLRTVFADPPHGDDEWAAVAGYAAQILHFQTVSRFCGRCGTEARPLAGGWAKECPTCGFTLYPPVSPAVLALVHDDNGRVLLAQKPGWGTRWSILAGFVEPGESLEACAVREVLEEVGVRVGFPQYVGSQPWPFQHQVMVGFTAQWESGDIEIDATELERAEWFAWDALPDLPPPVSLSRQIIDSWVAARKTAVFAR